MSRETSIDGIENTTDQWRGTADGYVFKMHNVEMLLRDGYDTSSAAFVSCVLLLFSSLSFFFLMYFSILSLFFSLLYLLYYVMVP